MMTHSSVAVALVLVSASSTFAQEAASQPSNPPSGPYVVLAVAMRGDDAESKAWREIAVLAAESHGGEVVDFDGKDWPGLEGRLTTIGPENVLVVIRPRDLDIVFHRRLVTTASHLDDDPCVDFVFGYITGRDAAHAEKFRQRTLKLRRDGLRAKIWTGLSVTTGNKSMTYRSNVPDLARAAGFVGNHHYIATKRFDPRHIEFFESVVPDIAQSGVLEITGNGDPQGVWLFDDDRNLQADKHWPFDPAKVGHDPKGEMPRLTAERLRKLPLDGAVVWSGTCHSAAASRVFVEGDIVSTFGKTGPEAVVYELDPDTSFLMAMLDAGVAAFMAPIGANHGFAVGLEAEFALREGASLGEILKSTYDDVLVRHPRLVLDLPEPGKKPSVKEPVMAGGGINRLLIGDPACRPFAKTEDVRQVVDVELDRERGETRVTVKWAGGFHYAAWDLYGTDRLHPRRICARVAVTIPGPVHLGKESAPLMRIEASDAERKPLPLFAAPVVRERRQGRQYLHLQANYDEKLLPHGVPSATFVLAGLPIRD